MRTASMFAAAAGLALTAVVASADEVISISDARADSTALRRYAGARALSQDGRLVTLFGVPMTGGATPALAAQNFWAQHGRDFGVGELDLRPTRQDVVQNGSTVIAYQQYLADLPVDRGLARIMVHPDGNRVTLASGRFAREPEGGFAPIAVTATDAVASVRDAAAYAGMVEWTEPSLMVHDAALGGLDENPRVTWVFIGRNNSGEHPRSYKFFVDASTGVMVEARDMISYVDITGKVEVKATPGVKPDSGSNPPAVKPVELIRVKGPATVETDVLGNYLMPYGGTTATNLNVGLNDGRWVRVVDQSGTSVLSLTQSVTPPGPGNFLLNNSPTEFTTAQANAFVHTIRTHEHFKKRVPTFTALDIQIPANVNWNSSCNAYFDGGSINFYRNSGGCVNTSYADVVSHEYGHFVVQQLGLEQNAFGEGYGDSCGILIHDTGIIGTDFCGVGCHVRNIDAANKQYPCSGGVHDCGQVLAGVWRDLRLKLTDVYGSGPALQLAGDLHVDWSLITIGQQNGSNGAWPQTGIEVLTVDDDDGTLLNGTPNYPSIFYAFDKHNIDLPVVQPVAFLYPDGRPSTVSHSTPTNLTVQIVDGSEHSIPATAVVQYRTQVSDPFTSVSMTHAGGGNYSVTLPGDACGTVVEYKFSIDTTENAAGYTDPPTGAYSYIVVSSGPVVFADDFEAASGFAVSGSIGLGLQGRWQLVDPNGTTDSGFQVAPEDDTTGSGTKCWVTGNGSAGGAASASDIDGGDTILTSPAFSLVGVANPAIAYQRWFYNNDGADSLNYLTVQISNDNGSTWTQVEKVQGASTGGWVYREFDPTAFLAATANMKVRFLAADKTPDDLVEAGVDDFRVFSVECDDGCPADFDGSGFVDTDDFDAFVLAFEAGGDDADFDGSGFVDTDDFDAFVVAYIEGC